MATLQAHLHHKEALAEMVNLRLEFLVEAVGVLEMLEVMALPRTQEMVATEPPQQFLGHPRLMLVVAGEAFTEPLQLLVLGEREAVEMPHKTLLVEVEVSTRVVEVVVVRFRLLLPQETAAQAAQVSSS
jgi:hypothetical protein